MAEAMPWQVNPQEMPVKMQGGKREVVVNDGGIFSGVCRCVERAVALLRNARLFCLMFLLADLAVHLMRLRTSIRAAGNRTIQKPRFDLHQKCSFKENKLLPWSLNPHESTEKSLELSIVLKLAAWVCLTLSQREMLLPMPAVLVQRGTGRTESKSTFYIVPPEPELSKYGLVSLVVPLTLETQGGPRFWMHETLVKRKIGRSGPLCHAEGCAVWSMRLNFSVLQASCQKGMPFSSLCCWTKR